MTLADPPVHGTEDPVPGAGAWHPRSEVELAEQQLHAVARFHRARHMREEAAAAAARSRELRMDAARSMDVLRRQHQAVVAHAHEQLRASGQLLCTTAERRVVVAHRNEWLVGKVVRGLEERGVQVVARTDNGADAVGLVVAEQPDLVLVEDTLAMLPGVDVIREVRRFSPETVVVAQAAHGDRVGQLLDAGATTVFTRSIPPQELTRSVLRLVGV
jgi:CheY-like chemotaxis protein